MYVIFPNKKMNWSRFCWYEGALTPEECDKVIAYGQTLQLEAANVFDGEVPTINEKARKSNVSWIKHNQEIDWLYKKLSNIALDANNVRFNLDLVGYLEDIQYTEYGPNGHYQFHQDFGNNDVSVRKISQVVLLSDPADYEGGQLEFFNSDENPPKTRGTVICFPSFEFHRVAEVLSGHRKSLVAWIQGPPYR